jgi:hypothetical protein
VSEPNWIPVSEKLPAPRTWVLAYPTSNGAVTKTLYYGKGLFYTVMGEEMATKVTHWMPLPEPPSQEAPSDLSDSYQVLT